MFDGAFSGVGVGVSMFCKFVFGGVALVVGCSIEGCCSAVTCVWCCVGSGPSLE